MKIRDFIELSIDDDRQIKLLVNTSMIMCVEQFGTEKCAISLASNGFVTKNLIVSNSYKEVIDKISEIPKHTYEVKDSSPYG
jgi:uncharacterized protein YlzI (FlbEa/FlbD family)